MGKGNRHSSPASFCIKAVMTSASIGLLFGSSPAGAEHSWSGLHWARTSNPFTVTLGSNVTANWLPYIRDAVGTLNQPNATVGYWSVPTYSAGGTTVESPVRTKLVTGLTSARTCKAKSGTVQVCNAKYGYNGWLGVATVWTSGGHIVQSTVKLNDSYYSLSTYNTPAWRATVACQEIGHAFGLDHQDEDQSNDDLKDANGIESCMDYTSNPAGNGQPNFHDYEELAVIYDNHTDSATTLASSAASAAAPCGSSNGARAFAYAATRRSHK